MNEETKVEEDEDVDEVEVEEGERLLRFDASCLSNPGPGGARAALSKPGGTVVWTCSHYMPIRGETNNTAEYMALLLGTRAAADHGVKHLRVEGDSTLVIQQVRGIFTTRNRRLRRLQIWSRQKWRGYMWRHFTRSTERLMAMPTALSTPLSIDAL